MLVMWMRKTVLITMSEILLLNRSGLTWRDSMMLLTSSEASSVSPRTSNRGNSGAKASASHSASLAANDAVCDQLLRNVCCVEP